MADEISNKTLAILLIAAIAISLGGTIFSLNRLAFLMRAPSITGYVLAPTGTATVTVSQTSSLRFSISALDFGTGSVNTTTTTNYCHMASGDAGGSIDGVAQCVSFNAAGTFKSLEIENDGNRNLTLVVKGSKAAAAFIGGTSPQFRFYVSNNETGSCATPLANETLNWVDVNTTDMNICIGTGLDYLDGRDSMDIHLNISIPYNSLTGAQSVTITATGIAV